MAVETRVVAIDPDNPDPSLIEDAARIVREGGLVAFPTETVYGLGADATNPRAVAAIFEAKGRPANNPLIVHVDGLAMARDCAGAIDEATARLMSRWWPGPVTFVVGRSSRIPDIVTAGSETVALRIPRPPVARALITAAGRPLAAPSANRSTRVSPTRAEHVLADLEGRVSLILDAGPTDIGLESTVVDLTDWPPRLLRPGPVPLSAILEGLSTRVGQTEYDRPLPPGPGRMRVHYAPRTPAYWVEPADLERLPTEARAGLLRIGPGEPGELEGLTWQESLGTPEEAARRLYAALHEVDALALDVLYVLAPPAGEEWAAVRDRVWRATRPLPADDVSSA